MDKRMCQINGDQLTWERTLDHLAALPSQHTLLVEGVWPEGNWSRTLRPEDRQDWLAAMRRVMAPPVHLTVSIL